MERIIEVAPSKISDIRGYMANSGVDCASGTCDCGGGGINISSEEVLIKELQEITEEFFN
ncbi:hypothetical protein [Dickeya dadantii]|uniref:hypothetical protein n=1 Tax=Dickeya dadantii TaxID=204038 RepID=UPI0002F4EBB5|nr:hypothetical protein [Dickeya dadantii]MCL6407260.1 hypothetical protein [Dickeya dadantii]NPE50516.1 hypothetical protein [Dickeya dadantii]NPE56292.1 hypothetical protein [Dickeya dadantii]NPE59781.1 hypothetical protein [Dickeya dadantii]NPE63142.1 hypothetical protein [Dickeya dadantii]